MDLNGSLIARVTDNRNFISLALSPDESKIAAQVDEPDAHIWILDSKTGQGSRISNSSDQEAYPHWAPDGKSVFYISNTLNGQRVQRHFLDNSTQPELLWQSPSAASAPTTLILAGVSPEGRYLLVHPTNGESLSRLDLQSPSPRKLEPLTQGLGIAYLSRDGRSLAWGMSREGGFAVQAYPPVSEPANRFRQSAAMITLPFFSADSRTLYAQSGRNLLAFPLSEDRRLGEPKLLRPWISSTRVGATAGVASRDGKRLLLLETDQTESLNAQVLTDWTTLLPK